VRAEPRGCARPQEVTRKAVAIVEHKRAAEDREREMREASGAAPLDFRLLIHQASQRARAEEEERARLARERAEEVWTPRHRTAAVRDGDRSRAPHSGDWWPKRRARRSSASV
jgi:hypothetical protein